jgi:ankyrin repeat protein
VCLANHSNLVIKSSDFDRDKFLAELLAIQEIERVAAENLAEGTPNSLFSALMLAALLGDLEIVRTLLDNGAIPIAVDHNNKNALMFAAEFGHLEIVRLLLPSGINVNAVTDEGDGIRETALSYAADKGHYAVCQLLLQSGARLDIVSSSMPLHKAAEHGDAELCRLFIQHGADINQINSCDETPLFCAVDNQQLTICKLLLNSGAEINTFVGEGQTILGVAAFGGNTELVEYLLSQGAQVDGLEDITIGLKKGLTPLMHAAIKDYPAIVEILLDRGALINITTFEGNSALWFACHNFSQGAATLLLQRGADPNLINRYGSSIIETTAKSGNDEIVKLLIQHGVALFSQRNKGYQALEIAVEEGHVSMAQLLLAANVPAEMIVDQHATSLLILAMQSLSGNTLLEMLTLLLQQNISLRKTDDEGNDALMLSVHTTGFHVMSMLIKHGALIGQVNKYGQNALAIAIDAIDALDLSVQIDRLKMMYAFTKLVNLLNQAQKQPNWLALRKDALNRAQHALTREIILVSWAWPHVGNGLLIVDLAKININVGALHDFIQFVINSPCAISREKIVYMLGMAGLCPPLIDLVGPYIGALHQFKSLLFGHSATGHDKAISAFIAGLAAPLEKIHLPLGLHWTPYIIELSNMPAGTALNQIANAELDSLMSMSLAIESEHTATVFKTLFETCFNLSFTEKSLPATFPAYAAASGALADALMAKSVYSALATKIESAWKTAWAKFEGKEMSSAPSTTSSSTSSASATSLGIDFDDPFGLFSVDDLPATGMDKISMSTLTAFFSESPQGQALLKEFRTQLLLAIDDAQENILHAPNVTDEAAQIYAELMLRQVNMLKRLFL